MAETEGNWTELPHLSESKCNKVRNLLNRNGHARFRQTPVDKRYTYSQPQPTITVGVDLDLSLCFNGNQIRPPVQIKLSKDSSFNRSPSLSSSTTSSFMSTITGDGSVSNGKLGPDTAVLNGKPLLSSSHRLSSDHCHCSKKRKSRMKNTIRVPTVSSKIADIPADEFSWRKYGQKSIKGSHFTRAYYKCSTVKGCPVKKHVERDMDDPKILIVTYVGEHRHQHERVSGTVHSVDAKAMQ